MAIFKKIMINISIVLGVLLLVCGLCIGILYFAPNVNIFGIRWRKPAQTFSLGTGVPVVNGYKQVLKQDFSRVEKIILNTGKIPVKIQQLSDADKEPVFDEAHPSGYVPTLIEFHDQVTGLTNAKIVKNVNPFDLGISYSTDKTVATISLKEVNGWFIYNSSNVTIKLDDNFYNSLNDKTVEISTASGNLNVDIGTSKTLNKLVYKTNGKSGLTSTKGSFTLNSPVKSLDVSTQNGKINIDKNVSENLNITTKSSSINLNTQISGNVIITATNSKVNFGRIDGKFSYVGTTNEDGTLNYASGGKITGNLVGNGIFVKTKNAQTDIDQVLGEVNADISAKGKLKIGLADADTNNLNVKATDGDINITATNFNEASLKSRKGDINFNVATSVLLTNYKQITVEGKTYFTDVKTRIIFNGYFNNLSSISNLKIVTTSGKVNLNTAGSSGFIKYHGTELNKTTKIQENYTRDVVAYYGYNGKADITTEKGVVNISRFGYAKLVNYLTSVDNNNVVFSENITETLQTQALNVRVVKNGSAKINVSMFGVGVGSSVSAAKGEIKIKMKTNIPAYIVTNCGKAPSIKLGLVTKFADDFKPTAVGGATLNGYTAEGAQILTINNVKGKTSITEYLDK